VYAPTSSPRSRAMSTKTVLGLAFAAVLGSVALATPAMAIPDEPTTRRGTWDPAPQRCLGPGDALYDHPQVVVEKCRPETVAKPTVDTPKVSSVETDWSAVQLAGGTLAGITVLGAGVVGAAGLRRRRQATGS
jgi:hypothetical protein